MHTKLIRQRFPMFWALLAGSLFLHSCATQTPNLDRYDMEPQDLCLTPFGEETETPERDVEEEFARARMAFLFGKYQFSYGIWKELGSAGHADSQASLGWMYQTGKGVKKDRKEAVRWYLKAAAQHHPIAQNNLGVLYEQGWGVKKNTRFAARWYRESAEWGYPYGQFNLGMALYHGRGVKKDRKEAVFWLDLAALQGVKEAHAMLVKMGMAQPEKHPKPLLSAAARTEDPNAPVALRKTAWIMSQNPRHYTIQLMSARMEDSILQFVFHNRLRGKLAYGQMPEKNGKPGLYVLIVGEYATFQEAKTAIGELPDTVQQSKPFVRRYADIQGMLQPPPPTPAAEPSAK